MAGYVETSVLGFTSTVTASDVVTENIIRDFIRARYSVEEHDAASPQQIIDAFTQGLVDYALEVVAGYRANNAADAARAAQVANPPVWED